MTQDELDQYKDVTELRCAIFQGPEDGIVEDIYGVEWLTGQMNGERVKRRWKLAAPSINTSGGG